MLVGSACFDPQEGGGGGGGGGLAEDGFSQTHVPNCSPNFSIESHSYHHHHHHQQQDHSALAMDMEFQPNWEDMNLNYQPQNFTVPLAETVNPYPPTPDLLNTLPLPRCTDHLLGLLGDHGTPASSILYDPQFPMNLTPQPPNFLREFIHSLPPHGYSGSRSGSLFSGVVDDQGELGSGGGQFFQDGSDHDNGVFEFTAEMNCMAKGREGKGTKHFATEKQRRVQINDKYSALRSLVPNPTKNDRASIVGDAIDYINELKRTVGELMILVEKKRCSRERLKRQRSENGSGMKTENDHVDQPFHGSELRSSWLHRKSKNTEVDVRIIDDEVTVKLVQQKRINCLLLVSKALDELQLDLHHVAGGLIGDYYSFFLNSKIAEGSTVYAHAIANKLIDAVDKQYAAAQPTSSY